MPPKKAKGAYKKPERIPSGEVLKDMSKKEWRLGQPIGTGGFGDIYLASDNISKNVDQKATHVIKVEPKENGPLFCELAFFTRVAKPEMIADWKKTQKLDNLGVPSYSGFGIHEYKGNTYRFLVLPRFEKDFHKILEERPDKRFSIKTACAISLQMMYAYEYIHSEGYVHADLKGSNLMLERKKQSAQVFLLDYGLATKFLDDKGEHIKYSPNPKKAHNGTLEYESRDAHIGAFSRRGDMEVLGYNLIEWVFGSLPWSRDNSPEEILKKKQKFMSDLNLKKLFPNAPEGSNVIEEYLKYVASLDFTDKPDYSKCRGIFSKALPKSPKGSLFLDEKASSPAKVTSKGTAKRKSSDEAAAVSPAKRANNNTKSNGTSSTSTSAAGLSTNGNNGMTPQMLAVQAAMKAKAAEKEKKTMTKRKAPPATSNIPVPAVRPASSSTKPTTSVPSNNIANGRVTRQQTRIAAQTP